MYSIKRSCLPSVFSTTTPSSHTGVNEQITVYLHLIWMVQDDVDAVQARQQHYHKTLKIKGFTAGVVEKLQIQKVVVAVMENIQGHARG